MNINSTSSYLPIRRKHSREFLPRILLNSLGKMSVYVKPISEIRTKYFHYKGKKLFWISYEIDTNFVKFAPISREQYFS